MNSSSDTRRPAERLEGEILPNGWTVTKLIERAATSTGGRFSTPYIVRSKSGEEAFLKAMDYTEALDSEDPAKLLESMTRAYNFERDLLEKCQTHRLSRVVKVLDSGTLRPAGGDRSMVVQYLIFELADRDIRAFVEWNTSFDIGWAFRTLHQAAAALQQLHSVEIAHQDVKPSNILVFKDSHSKLADFGRAFDRNSVAPHDGLSCPGDKTYAPPELLYGYVPQDWRARRFGCDMYLLGSLVVFLFAGLSATHLLFARVHQQHHYDTWVGEYKEVLPYLQRAFAQMIRGLQLELRPDIADAVADLVEQLCNPEPVRRGHPKNILSGGNQYALGRYVSVFDRLAKRAELLLTRRNRNMKMS